MLLRKVKFCFFIGTEQNDKGNSSNVSLFTNLFVFVYE